MNPWLARHPALQGRLLSPPPNFYRSVAEGAAHDRVRVLLNPGPSWERPIGWKRTEGPVPPRGGQRVKAPTDATNAVYNWLVDQAVKRAKDLKDHIRTGSPGRGEMARKYGVRLDTVDRWVAEGKEKGIRAPDVRRFSPTQLGKWRGTYFASGSEGSPGEMTGFAELADRYKGMGMGIDLSKCTPRCWLALTGEILDKQGHPRQIPGQGLHRTTSSPLFVDSGAFSAFTKNKKVDWPHVLKGYEVIAKKFKSRAYLVAPDKIGDPVGTRALIGKYAKAIAKIAGSARTGPWILLAAQGRRGRDRAKDWEETRKVLVRAGVPKSKIVAALPMKEAAFTLAEIERFFSSVRDAPAAHLLGMGPFKEKRFEAVSSRIPNSVRLTCDSVMITGGVGRGFLGLDPKIYTYAQDLVRYAVMGEAFRQSLYGGEGLVNWVEEVGWDLDPPPDYTDSFIEEASWWLPGSSREVLLQDIRDRYRGRGALVDAELLRTDPEAFLRGNMWKDERHPAWYEDPLVDAWLHEEYERFLGAFYSASVKRGAIVIGWKRPGLEFMRAAVPGIGSVVSKIIFGERSRGAA